MTPGPLQIALIVLVILVLFGRGRISEFMGDFGKGIKSFKSGLSDDDGKSSAPSPRINGPEETVSGEKAKQPDGSDQPR